jgi:hypothetical protein
MKNVLIGLLVLLLCACATTEQMKIVPVDLSHEKLTWGEVSDVLQPDSIIPIASGDYTIANCKKIVLKDHTAYLYDNIQQKIFAYDIAKQHLLPVIDHRGNANFEYLELTDFDVTNNGEIAVFDSDKSRVLFYSGEGEFVRSVKVCSGSALSISPSGDICINNGQLDDKNIVTIYNAQGKLTHSIPKPADLPDYLIESSGSICATEEGIFYATPFDFTLYKAKKQNATPYVSFDFGETAFSLDGNLRQNPRAIGEYVIKNPDKVLLLRSIGYYGGLLFLSTDMNHQLLYRTQTGTVQQLSLLESPYHILFSSPISCNEKGSFCSLITDSNVNNALIPSLSVHPTGQRAIDALVTQKRPKAQYWLMLGHIIKKD